MAFQRGEVVLVPFPYTDLTATKTRPAVIVSSRAYQAVRSEHLVAYVSSQIAQVTLPVDYVMKVQYDFSKAQQGKFYHADAVFHYPVYLKPDIEEAQTATHLRPFGLCAGEFEVPDDFDNPLPDEILKAFEGE